MASQPVRRSFLAAAALAGAVAGMTAGCGQSARDRHYLSQSMVHQPVSPERAAAVEPPASRPIATVPTGVE